MSRTIDPDTLGFVIGDVARLLRADIDRRICAAGLELTPAETRLLVQAARAGSVRQSVLAERIGIEAMTVSSHLDRLEARGLIRRVADPADRRAKLVELTQAADKVLARIKPLAEAVRADAAAGLTPEEMDHVMASLKRMRANLSAARSERKPAA